MRRSIFAQSLTSSAAMWLCSIEPAGQEEEAPPQTATTETAKPELTGELTRVAPDGGVEEQALAEYRAAHNGEDPPKPEGEGEAEKEPEEKPEAGEYDFKGTPFEGMTPEFQASVTPFVQAFEEAGTLTDEQIAEAAKATGFTESMVRNWMEGVQAQAKLASAETALDNAPVFEAVGGPEQFADFQKWTTEEGNVSPAEERAINKLLKEDPEAAAAAMKPLVERWKAAGNGAAPRDLSGKGSEGGPGGAEGVEPYGDWSQVQKDMNNPDYQRSETFRRQVEARLAVSNF